MGGYRKWMTKIAATIAAPVDDPGEWVLRDNFSGRKSFGFFLCKKCRKRWTSAHSYPNYTQGCKTCKAKNLPALMWVNSFDSERRDRVFDESKKPHARHLCAACKAGVCDAEYDFF